MAPSRAPFRPLGTLKIALRQCRAQKMQQRWQHGFHRDASGYEPEDGGDFLDVTATSTEAPPEPLQAGENRRFCLLLFNCFIASSPLTTDFSICAQTPQEHSYLSSPPFNMGEMQRPRRRGDGLSNQTPRSHRCTDTAFCEDKFGGGKGGRYSPGQTEERRTIFGRVHEHSKERG